MAQETDKALLRKFIAGNCTLQEQERVRALLAEPGSESLFSELLEEDWAGFHKESEAGDDWIRDYHRRLKDRLDHPQVRGMWAKGFKFYRYAAVWGLLMLGIGASIMLWQLNKHQSTATVALRTVATHYGQRSRILLADSSVVTLGSGSTLEYPANFKGTSREIRLSGEAFFEVKKNPDKPFLVHTGQVDTRVLGTSFKIDAFSGQAVTVSVATGKVQVSRRDSSSGKPLQLATLSAGDAVTWHPVSGKATLNAVNAEDIAAWQKGELVFTGMPLKEVAVVLERWYNAKVTIADSSKSGYRMNMVIDGTKPLKRSLEVLKATIKADYRISGNHVTIQ